MNKPEFTFYRQIGPRSIRIEANPIENGQWKMFIIGDQIPTIDELIVDVEMDVFTTAYEHFSSWAALDSIKRFRH